MPTIPQSPMERLRQGTNQFSEARRRTDDVDQMDTKQRAAMAAALRAAEQELEVVTRQIEEFLSPSSSSSTLSGAEPDPGAGASGGGGPSMKVAANHG